MINGAVQEQRADLVSRLVSLLAESVDATLIKRGLPPESVEDAREGLSAVEVPISPANAVDFSFSARDGAVPFSLGRFGDGHSPVFYSALEEETCVAELTYWQGQQLAATSAHPRYYDVVACDFLGAALILRGHENEYPDLVSATDAGYPFCRAVASWAREQGASALYTTSARRDEGTCVPVFARQCLSNVRRGARYRFSRAPNGVVHERLP